MRYRDLGTTGLRVSEIGVGCSRLGGVFAPGTSRKEELALLGAALDAGINFFDTSDFYSQGESEVLLGKAFRRRRSEVVIATKGGYLVPSGRRRMARLKPLLRPVVQRFGLRRRGGSGEHGGPLAQDFSPPWIRSAVEASLRRLATDAIDLYQLHSPPRSAVEADDLVSVVADLQREGKLRHFGIAADAPQDVTHFERQHGLASLQIPFSLLQHDGAAPLIERASKQGIGVIARSCYAAGLFREDVSEPVLRQQTPDAGRIIELRRAADQIGRPLLEAALQFNLAVEQISVTLLGMRTTAHLNRNLELYGRPPLSPGDRAALAAAGVPAAGTS